MNNEQFLAWLKGYLTAKEEAEVGLSHTEISVVLQKMRNLSEIKGPFDTSKTLLKG